MQKGVLLQQLTCENDVGSRQNDTVQNASLSVRFSAESAIKPGMKGFQDVCEKSVGQIDCRAEIGKIGKIHNCQNICSEFSKAPIIEFGNPDLGVVGVYSLKRPAIVFSRSNQVEQQMRSGRGVLSFGFKQSNRFKP